MTDLDVARADAVDLAAHHLAVAAAELAPWFPGLLADVEIVRARVHALRPPARVTPLRTVRPGDVWSPPGGGCD
jgi:hypothetical protein